MTRDPTHAELQKIVLRSEVLLRDVWARRKADTDLIVLADWERPDTQAGIAGWWSPEGIERVRAEMARRSCPAYLPFIQPAGLIDHLLSGQCGWAQREAGKELKGFAAAGFVPLWVAYPGGHWATAWAAPGSNMVVVRYEPEPAADRN